MDFTETPTVADPRVSATSASAVFAGLGRITQMVGQDGTSTYGYDATSQLTSATHTYQSNETYTYDANGNRTMTGYQTGTDNRLTNDGTYSYTYDAEGNRLTRTKTATGEVTEYTWDYHNRLTKATDKNSQGTVTQVVEYVYDVFDRRIGRKLDTSAPFDMANAVIERYVLDDIHNGLVSADGGNEVLDFVDPDGSGAQAIATSNRYLWGEAVDQLFAQEDLYKTLGDAARNLWPLVDNLGTLRDLAKQDGTIATHYKYDSFGNVTSGDTSKTRYLFTSREFDTATKLQYNRARYYDAAVGRWISEDPLGFAAGDANVGRYVGNQIVDAGDPSGLVPWRRWPFNVNWGGGVTYLTGSLMISPTEKGLKLKVQLRRPIERPGFGDDWNGLDSEVPDSWNRKSYAGDDQGREWLWPHLNQLITIRTPRYGGWDPYKKVDNDYAAVLIQPIGESGEPTGPPLVSGDWHPIGGNGQVSHSAGSSEFLLPPAHEYRVWLIMADTFGDRHPPKAPPESAGCALAYWVVSRSINGDRVVVDQPALPAPPTNFDWDDWSLDEGSPRLHY